MLQTSSKDRSLSQSAGCSPLITKGGRERSGVPGRGFGDRHQVIIRPHRHANGRARRQQKTNKREEPRERMCDLGSLCGLASKRENTQKYSIISMDDLERTASYGRGRNEASSWSLQSVKTQLPRCPSRDHCTHPRRFIAHRVGRCRQLERRRVWAGSPGRKAHTSPLTDGSDNPRTDLETARPGTTHTHYAEQRCNACARHNKHWMSAIPADTPPPRSPVPGSGRSIGWKPLRVALRIRSSPLDEWGGEGQRTDKSFRSSRKSLEPPM
ncbi:hypothetical protein F5148DRAFT_742469 [Russula earlei]|uniref:Uncharacterized protein n=1 Tax=Russula earlei TaxID=71964 RepID=A0ACC0UDI8_9AGAM|nr:hypothetical protein F5148DRAFT_742469 [Russula earlei]